MIQLIYPQNCNVNEWSLWWERFRFCSLNQYLKSLTISDCALFYHFSIWMFKPFFLREHSHDFFHRGLHRKPETFKTTYFETFNVFVPRTRLLTNQKLQSRCEYQFISLSILLFAHNYTFAFVYHGLNQEQFLWGWLFASNLIDFWFWWLRQKAHNSKFSKNSH